MSERSDSQTTDPTAATARSKAYPPEHHIVRDLAVVIDRSRGDWEIRLPIVPAIFDATGHPRVGVAAVIADMIAGQTAIREVSPAWIATSNLGIQVSELPTSGTLVGRARVLRKGATTIVIEVALDDLERGVQVGLSTLGFAILPRQNELQVELNRARMSSDSTTYAPGGHGFTKPLYEAMGIVFDPSEPGRAEVPLDPYLQNTLGALQGGVVAILMESAAERLATSILGGVVRTRGLELQYLKLGRKGPIFARARVLARTPAGLVARVELFDRGDADALLTVATVWLEKAGSFAISD